MQLLLYHRPLVRYWPFFSMYRLQNISGTLVSLVLLRYPNMFQFISCERSAQTLTSLSCAVGAVIAKPDTEQAFRLLPLRPGQWHFLGYACEGQCCFHVALPYDANVIAFFILSIFWGDQMDRLYRIPPFQNFSLLQRLFYRRRISLWKLCITHAGYVGNL